MRSFFGAFDVSREQWTESNAADLLETAKRQQFEFQDHFSAQNLEEFVSPNRLRWTVFALVYPQENKDYAESDKAFKKSLDLHPANISVFAITCPHVVDCVCAGIESPRGF